MHIMLYSRVLCVYISERLWRERAMTKSLYILLVSVAAMAAGSDAVLQYDDGTVTWVTNSGAYRGVWFNTDDFLSGSQGFLLEESILWLYNPADCYVEIWNGDYMAPTALLDRTLLPAGSGSITYSPPIDCDENFWIILNTTLSGGGWPAVLADGTGYTVACHSFYSEDFFMWEPWSDQTVYGDFLIRASGEFETGLGTCTWGSIKAVFQGSI
jgi:hypothetical protein